MFQTRILILRAIGAELYQVSLSPLQGELVILRDPRVETWLKPWAEFFSHLRGINHLEQPSLISTACGSRQIRRRQP
jgi:hypothetical protein